MTEESELPLLARAEAGDAQAQHALAVSYAIGEFGDADLEKARRWYRHAADAGEPVAAFNLAVMLMNGEGGEADKEGGLLRLNQAVALGSSDAMILLADLADTDTRVGRQHSSQLRARALQMHDLRGARDFVQSLQETSDEECRAHMVEVFLNELGMQHSEESGNEQA